MRFGEVTTFVSLVIPCLNEEAAIGAIVRDCLARGIDEVIVVDGGSTDATAEKAAAAGARVVVETARVRSRLRGRRLGRRSRDRNHRLYGRRRV